MRVLKSDPLAVDVAGLKVGLVGTYVPDRRMSMIRYTEWLMNRLLAAGFIVVDLSPRAVFPRLPGRLTRVLDKLWFMLVDLRYRARQCQIVHIVDQGDARYSRHAGSRPVVVTCHDMYMLQGHLQGTEPLARQESFKKSVFLERLMLEGLQAASGFFCDSTATLNDLKRLPGVDPEKPARVVYLGFNYPFKFLSKETAQHRLAAVDQKLLCRPFLMHIGNSTTRKNRKAVLEVACIASRKTDLLLVIAGNLLDEGEKSTPAAKELADKLIQIHKPSDEMLEALYNLAHCLVFPSYFEGFGWPVIEAQACGCPVICSNTSSLPEIAGVGALTFDPDDSASMSDAVLSLFDKEARQRCIAAGLANIERFREINVAEPLESLYAECLVEFSKNR